LPIEEAKKSGAVALFGEKYGDFVRVVQIGSRSREFCGGTHASRSGDLGFVKVTNEGSISAGVRRIEAVAGIGAFKQIMKQREILQQLLSTLRTNESELVDRVEKVLSRNIELEREVEKLSSVLNMAQSGDLTSSAVVLKDGTKVVASVIEKATPKQLREVADDLKSRLGSGCIALASVSDGKAIVLTAVTEDLTKKYHAGNLMKELNKVVGGHGGGRADLAQAGGGDPEKIHLGLDKFRELVS
jgi:alanyl-tRNA synthetase